MKVFAISDLHLSAKVDKPMDIFGGYWENHLDKIKQNWEKKVSEGDLVLLAGDFSWAMSLGDAQCDFESLKELPGKKILIKGNHDYWWNSISKVRAAAPENFFFLQNDAAKFGEYVLFGSRGWSTPGSADYDEKDKKIYLRESERLKLSLSCAKKLLTESDKLIGMIHFPPFNAKRENSLFTEIFEKARVDKVIYGHLHGLESKSDISVKKSGIEYLLTSCDKIGFKLQRVF